MFKSTVYFCGFMSVGYMLMKITEPNAEKIKAIKATAYSELSNPQSPDNLRKAEIIIQKLKEASEK